MEENVRQKLSKILSGLGGDKTSGKTSAISELLTSEEGKKLVKSLSESEKKAILSKFMSMNTAEISEKLKKADTSALSNMTVQDIKNKLR